MDNIDAEFPVDRTIGGGVLILTDREFFTPLTGKSNANTVVINAASSHLGVQDYELLAETVLSGTDVILRFDKYGKDNKIFEKLDAHDRINHTNIDFENTGVRGIVCYSATNGE